jgi:hypothetical protein
MQALNYNDGRYRIPGNWIEFRGEWPVSVLDDESTRSQLVKAWQESQPGTDDAHEEGGYVLQSADGSLVVQRWPCGEQNEILVPLHAGGKRNNLVIVATFHTHPNPGSEFQQEPSLTDIRAVRDDPELKHPEYEGEYVIAAEWTYRVHKNGRVETIARTNALLKSG